VKPGTHDVKALFAKTGWRAPDPKTSPTMTYTVQDDQTLVLNVSLGPANSPGMTTPTKKDWLRLTAPGEVAGTAQGSTTAIVRVRLAVIVLGGFVMSLVSHAGSLGHRRPGRHGCRGVHPRVLALPAFSTSRMTNRQVANLAASRVPPSRTDAAIRSTPIRNGASSTLRIASDESFLRLR